MKQINCEKLVRDALKNENSAHKNTNFSIKIYFFNEEYFQHYKGFTITRKILEGHLVHEHYYAAQKHLNFKSSNEK